MSDFGWPRRGFLNLVGLDHPESADGALRPVALAEAAIDPRTGGAVAINTKAELDGKDGVAHIKTYYWYMMPSGKQLSQKLFDIEMEQGEITCLDSGDHPVKIPAMLPRSVWVLGRKVYEAADEGSDTVGDTTQGDMRNLSRVMMAVGEVNRQIRQGKLPEVAKILKDCCVEDAVGERLSITGQSPKGGFAFDATESNGFNAPTNLRIPSVLAPALMGLGINTLDAHQRLPSEVQVQAADPRTGTVFMTEAKVHEGENLTLSTSIRPTSQFGSSTALAIPQLSDVVWKSDGVDNNGMPLSICESHHFLGEDLAGSDHLTRIRAIGATNRMMHDLRNRSYPPSMDHLVEYGLYNKIYQFEPPPPLLKGGRLSMISLGGNNMEEIAEGFGETIGGNSKVIYHEGLNKDGKIDRVGVIVDLGLHLSPKDEANIAAAPDVVEHLKHCNDIFITHRHLDHTDGLFAYIQYGYLKGKTVHATPEVIRSLRDKLRTYPGIHQDDLPTFSKLEGEGWIHIKDKEGKNRLSVNYARNAVPHTARCTPFFVHGHFEGKWIGSYLNPGDARYGHHNADNYKGEPVDADPLNREFFTHPNRRLLKEINTPEAAYKLNESIADRGPTYCDIDLTSVLRHGWAPPEHEVEGNLSQISDWFKDKGMILAMISTNDNRFETALRVATRAHRDMTEFGSNLEKTATTMNILGVNDLRHEPQPRNNIQHYLDQIFEERLTEKIDRHRASLETATENQKPEIERKIKRNEARLSAFQTLKEIISPYARYKARGQMEVGLQEEFGREATLGSVIDDPTDGMLGTVRVGRTSKTSRKIMSSSHDQRRLVLLTGTQGTNVEVDAALTALSEGRSLMDGNIKNSHTARPIKPEGNVVVISQTAIPGNDRKQTELVRKLVSRGFTVVQALHDGFQIHNSDKKHISSIVETLEKQKKGFKVEEDGSLVVSGMPIHAGGHGYGEDCRAWINLVKADVTAPQHTSDPQAVKRFMELCDTAGRRHMGRIVPNFEGISIDARDNPASTVISSIGRMPASIIRIHTERQRRKYHGGHMTAIRLVNQENEGGFRSDGLLATTREGGIYEHAFASLNAEQSAKDRAAKVTGRSEPVPENRMSPPEERPDHGAILPGQGFRHRLFGGQEKQSAGFVRT